MNDPLKDAFDGRVAGRLGDSLTIYVRPETTARTLIEIDSLFADSIFEDMDMKNDPIHGPVCVVYASMTSGEGECHEQGYRDLIAALEEFPDILAVEPFGQEGASSIPTCRRNLDGALAPTPSI